jgi:hypothetical protein
MTIDLERLAVDADYWDEVAPKGASHFMYSEKFVKWVDGVEWRFYVSSDKAWKKSMCSWSLQRYTDNGNEVVAKPTKPAAQEWDGAGMPPVGTECEFRIGGGPTEWHLCTVKYILDGDEDPDADGWRAVVWCPHLAKDQLAHLPRFQFRPIRSQAERERESIINLALERLGYDPSEFAGENKPVKGDHAVWDSLNYLYDLGMLRRSDK